MSFHILLLAGALIAVPSAAVAQQRSTTVTATRDRAVVSYADLDMASAHGRRVLKRRLAGAIEDVCGSFATLIEWSGERQIKKCRSAAWESADRQLAARPTDQKLALVVAR